MTYTAATVPCNGCTTCCQGDLVFIHPEMGDKADDYQTMVVGDRLALAHKDNGDCIYLDRGVGCTIHDRAPAICLEFDCRRLLKLRGKARALVGKKILRAARRLKRRASVISGRSR